MFVQLAKNAVNAKFLVAALLLLGFATCAEAQTQTVDIDKANLAIKYTASVTPADGLRVKCGPTSGGPYTRTTDAPVTTTLIPVKQIIGGQSGNWFCVTVDFVQTASGALEGKGSNEVNFFAATAPSGIIEILIIP